ncbi:MAG: MBL fold metallo-hydrolase [Desulfobulbus sp.]|nr:MBL fold metallo-hydrolase [Desulfobulbus sp.]
MNKGLFTVLKWRLTGKRAPWPEYRELPFIDQPPKRVEGDQLRVSFVGQVTTLVQTQGLNILTDPVWSDRASPFSWIGPSRVHPPGIRFEDLPPIDLVLISHNHYDHLDLATIKRLWQRDRPCILTPLGNDTLIHAQVPEAQVQSGDWGEQVMVNPQLTVHFEPMHHWSAQTPFDRNRALWAAFVLDTPGGRIYFVGDSGYGGGDYFRQAKKKYGDFRLAILPIGSYDPRWFMAYGHMNPEEAVLAWEILGKPFMLPTHYRTFQLADSGYEQPLIDLTAAMAAVNVAEGRIRPLMAGGHWWVDLLSPTGADRSSISSAAGKIGGKGAKRD